VEEAVIEIMNTIRGNIMAPSMRGIMTDITRITLPIMLHQDLHEVEDHVGVEELEDLTLVADEDEVKTTQGVRTPTDVHN